MPIFPLGLVLYPEEELPLHIFEPRYRDLIADCMQNDSSFGVVLYQEGSMSEIGCTAHIDKIVTAYDDGRKDILVTGEHRMQVLDVSQEKSYLTADVEILEDDGQVIDTNVRERVIAQHIKLLELAGRTPALTAYQDRQFLSFFIAHNSGLALEQKQTVLEMEGEAVRLEFLASHLEQFIPMVEEVEAIRMKVSSNGHFKDFPMEEGDEPD